MVLKVILTSFNPCFNGYSTLTGFKRLLKMIDANNCFNPCFNGYSTLTS